MAEPVVTDAPIAGAQPIVQSVEASQASAEQSILAAIQAHAAGTLTEKPANEVESPTGGDLANPFANPAIDVQPEPEPAPEAPKEEVETPFSEPPAKPETPQLTPEQASEASRQLIKQSNIDPTKKEEITAKVYKAERFEKLGFSVETAEAFKDLGVTPEVVIERTNLHPTLEDAKRDAQLAANMREVIQDLSTDPSAFLSKVSQANPAIVEQLRSSILSEIKSPEDLGEAVWFPFVQQSTWNLLENLQRASISEQDANLKEAIDIVRGRVFGQNAQPPQVRREAVPPDPNDPVRKELEQLKAEKARFEGSQRSQWETSLQNDGLKTVGELASKYLTDQGLTSLPGTFSQDATKELAMSVLQAIQSDNRLASDAQVFLRGPMTRERYQQGLDWLKSRASALINVHGQRVREKYRPLASTTSTAAPQPNAKPPAPRPDVARPSGASPRPVPGPNPTQQVFAAQKKGLSIEQMIAANSQAIAARRR